MNRWAVLAHLLLAGCTLTANMASAQTAQSGALSGTVTDPSGRVIQGVPVTATSTTTGHTQTAVTQSDGKYTVPLLPPDTYRVVVAEKNFKTIVFDRVRIEITETATLNVQLRIGSVAEVVSVEADALPLDTTSSAAGHVTDQRIVEDLPLVTRNYTQILGLSPGVSAEVFDAREIGRGGVDDPIVTGGGSYEDNNFQMNGVEVNDLQGSGHFSGGTATPNPDSIQEFKVQTGQYDASYGRDAGANVDVVTKAGTNRWHGNVWEYFRNEALNANDYFRNETGAPRAVLRENQFGFTLGGPIKKDKLLFFTSYQGTRQENGIDLSCSSSVFLPVLSGTDRSAAALAASVGPATAFGGLDPLGRPVTAANVSPQALALFNAKLPNGQYVIPNPQTVITDPTTGLPEGFSTYSASCPYTENQFITNLDWLQSAKSSFQGRFFFANSQATFTLPTVFSFSGGLPGSPTANPQNFRNFSLTHTYLFSNHLVNQVEIGFHRTHAGTNQSFPVTYSDLGSVVPSFDDSRAVISVFGGLNIGGNGQSVILGQNTYVFQDTVSLVHGRNSFRLGGGVTRAQDNMSSFEYGAYSVFLNYPGLMLGQAPYDPFETIDLAGITPRNWRIWDGNLYGQDDFKLTSRLTLNLGFRYERLGDFSEVNGRNATMNPSLINPNPPDTGSLAGFVVADNYPGTLPAGVTTSGNNMGIYGTGQNTLNPRIGFAWVLPGLDQVVLRGGYGIYHQRATGQPYLQQVTNQPFGLYRENAPDLTNGFNNPFAPVTGTFPQFFPYMPPTSAMPTSFSPVIIDLNLRPPVFQRYSLNVQTQIAKDFVLEVGYAGMRGTHMLVFRDINEAPLATADNQIRGETTTTIANIPFRVPYEGFSASSMYDIQSTGFAWYNALEATLSKRFSHGLQFLASYTWSSDLANVLGSTNQPNGGVEYGDNNNPRADYGPDEFVRPQRFVFSGVYELPGPRNRRSRLGETLGGWKLTGVTTLQSGHRLPLLNNDTYNAYGIVSDFAEIVPGCPIATSGSTTQRLNNWINQNCIAPYPIIGDPEPPGSCGLASCPAIATAFGNSRMGILRGPAQYNTDLSIIKLFPVTERTNVEFRTEFFNAFNHPIFIDPDNTVSDGPSSFGHITTMAANPRIMQFALKVNF
jgi:hypothetical protein